MTFFKITGRQVINSHGEIGNPIVLDIEYLSGKWYEITTGEEIVAQYNQETERVELVSENTLRAPFVPDDGELRRIGMPVRE
jgi:hypothetical protein